MPAEPTLSVIIVSYNTRQMTLDCLRALYADLQHADLQHADLQHADLQHADLQHADLQHADLQHADLQHVDLQHAGLGGEAAEVWVVDNASRDGSAEAVRAAFPGVRLVENPRNAGFGAANNLAMREARGGFLLLLNSDAFVHPGAVAALVSYLRANPHAGAVGPRLLNQDGTVQPSCYRFPSPARAWLENLWVASLLPRHPAVGGYRGWAHDAARSVDWVIGACLLVRRTAYEQAGGFDEAFFMYQEETDWQRRLRDGGWDIAFTPSAVVTHLGGASGAAEQAKINAHFFDSLDYYTRKHHGMGGLVSLRLAMIVGAALRTLAWAAVAAAVPRWRPAARAKTRLQAWLCIRQATCWRGAGKGARV